ncbi:MAG: NDP-sugar synthase [Acidimicrobiia bacterium]|nr:NDP-sugar synthase [Acidimicrobiia bacterium]
MKAVVLVGGAGTRLRPLTFSTPKPLLPIANIPFLERQLHWLAGYGVDEAVLSLGYLPEAFLEHFSDERFGDMKLRFVIEHEPLGTAGGIRFAAEGINERLVVCNGDVLTDLDLAEFVTFHEARGASATISLARVENPSAFGVVPTRSDGEVIAFVEKPPRDQAPTNWINAGTYVLEPSVLSSIPPRLNVSIERETFPRMLEHPGQLYAMRSEGYWLDIGTPEKYFDAHLDVLAGQLGLPPTPTAKEQSPGVWVEPGAVVEDSATLEGPVLIGAGARVGAGAVVRRSVLGAGAVVGAGAIVHESVLLEGARLGDRESLDRVVLGDDVRLDVGGAA